jgi:hypothetical protein
MSNDLNEISTKQLHTEIAAISDFLRENYGVLHTDAVTQLIEEQRALRAELLARADAY